MLSREGKQTDRGAVGAEFIGYNRRRREALLLQEFPHQPNCRPSVPAGLNQEIQDFALTVHGTPEIELPPSNYDDHLVQVPAFGRSWPPTLNPPRIGPAEFQDPSSNCLIRDVETTLGKQVLNVPIAQRETAIEPDGMLDDDRWKAVTTVGYLAHPETLKHRPCRSHAVNVTMPAAALRDDSGLIFTSPRKRGRPLSDMGLTKCLRDCGLADRATVHGMRSAFRDWASERTNAPHAVMERALAHAVVNAVEAAYARSDLLERRRGLMQQWGEFVTGAGATVARLHG